MRVTSSYDLMSFNLRKELKEATYHTYVKCPICGRKDNDWKYRSNLCCECLCKVLNALNFPRSEESSIIIPFKKAIKLIRGHLFTSERDMKEFIEKVRKNADQYIREHEEEEKKDKAEKKLRAAEKRRGIIEKELQRLSQKNEQPIDKTEEANLIKRLHSNEIAFHWAQENSDRIKRNQKRKYQKRKRTL